MGDVTAEPYDTVCTKCHKPAYRDAVCTTCGRHGKCHKEQDAKHEFDCERFAYLRRHMVGGEHSL